MKFSTPNFSKKNLKGIGSGWWYESERHRLARLGLKTGTKIPITKTPYRTVFQQILPTFQLSPGSKQFIKRRGDRETVLRKLRSGGWKLKEEKYAMYPGSIEAWRGKNYLYLSPTHYDKLEIEKIVLIDKDVGQRLEKIFRKPYPYTLPDYAKEDIDDERLEFLLRNGYTKQDIAIFFNTPIGEVEEAIKSFRERTHFSKSSTQQEINKILYEPKDIPYRKVLTIEIPRDKSHHLDFLKAYTEFNTVGIWKNYKDKNIQVEIEFKDDKNESNSKRLLNLIQKLNKDKINEKVIYARVEPIEKSTLSYSLAQAKLFAK